MVHNLHFEVVVGAIELALFPHASALYFHNQMLAANVFPELVCKLNHFQLDLAVALNLNGTYEHILDNLYELLSLLNNQGVIFLILKDITELLERGIAESLDFLGGGTVNVQAIQFIFKSVKSFFRFTQDLLFCFDFNSTKIRVKLEYLLNFARVLLCFMQRVHRFSVAFEYNTSFEYHITPVGASHWNIDSSLTRDSYFC